MRPARASPSVDRILSQAALILEDVGVEGFNTNEISKRSGLTIGAIYHHFKNKEAIVQELCARWLNRVTDRYLEFEKLQIARVPDDEFWRLLLDHLYCAYKETIGLGAITRATEIWPNVHALEVKYDALVSARIAAYLRSLGVRVSNAERRRMAMLILSMMHYGLLLSATSEPAEARTNIGDLACSLGAITSRYRNRR